MFGNSYAGNSAIQRRRDEENRIRTMTGVVEADRNALQIADWEHKTQTTIKKNMIRNITLNLQNQDNARLSARQARLKELLSREDEQYRLELENLQESSTDKAKRMVEYARELKANREEQRKQFAQQQLERQWRMGCDDLRDLEGEQFKNHCLSGVQQQIISKVKSREESMLEEERWAAKWEEERLKQVERDDRESRERKAFNYETKMDLLDQMREKRSADERRAHDIEAERKAFRDNLARDEAAAQAEQKRRAMLKKAEMEEILRGNDRQLAAKAMQARLIQEQEMQDLAQAAQEHEADQRKKLEGKGALRKEMNDYREYLAARKANEAAIDKELEQLCLDEMHKANSKRDVQWMKEKMARESLMKDVYEGRYEQVKEREASAYTKEMQLYYDRQCMDREIADANRIETEEEIAMRSQHKIRKRELDNQVQHNYNKKQLEEARIMQEEEMALQAERQYRGFLNRERAQFEKTAFQPKAYGLKKAQI